MANYNIGQTVTQTLNQNIFGNNWQVIKVGVQGPPGTQFQINGGSIITLGKYGIYELDVSGIGYLTNLAIKSIPEVKDVYIDYVYAGDITQGGAAL